MAHEFLPMRDLRRARSLRRTMTDAERKLWHALKAHRFNGVGFRRQVPIGPYVADFATHAARLIIEVDGSQHGLPRHAASDAVRTEWLASRGYRLLRFWNNDVIANLDGVLTAIGAALPPSLPTPAGGEGEPLAGRSVRGPAQ
jgi:very-short-patch-repair endonuclease